MAKKSLAQIAVFDMVGTSPLLMHNIQMANPLNPFTREMKRLRDEKKKVKKDEDAELLIMEQMSDVEFFGGLYLDPADTAKGPCLPALSLRGCAIEGGRLSREGKTVERAVGCVSATDMFRVEYDGPRDPKVLATLPAFRDMRMVDIQGSKVLRTRPVFNEWSVNGARLWFDATLASAERIEEFVSTAGQACGVGDARSLRYGRFDVTNFRVASL